MNRIDKRFKALKREGRKAFIAFITAGYPSLAVTEKLVLAFEKKGVDIVELGVPFSDPMADGPVIQEASSYALKKNTRLIDILAAVKRIRRSTQIPICLMTYYNPIFCLGEKEFIRRAKLAGVDGIIVPDLPPEEAGSLFRLANKTGLDMACFVSPTTTRQRMGYINRISKGFVYYVSLTGVTGARKELPPGLVRDLKAAKRIITKPLCVGFGLSRPGQVRKIQEVSDGVIVGSAILKKVKENMRRKDLVKRVANFVACLTDA